MSLAMVERFADSLARTFAGPPGRFLVERPDGRGAWSVETWTPAAVLDHVNGTRRMGFPFDPERLKFAAFDLDGKTHPEGRAWSLATAQRIIRALADVRIAAILERSRSGKGFHVWILFDANGPRLADARELAAALLRTLGLVDDFSEKAGVPGFYPWPPKREGCGRVPYAPLFAATNGHASGLLCDFGTGEPFADQLAALDSAERTPADVFGDALATLRVLAPAPVKPERPKTKVRAFTGELSAFAETALAAEVARVGSATDGARHPTLYSAARNLGELVAGGELPRGLVESSLADAAATAGLVGGRASEVEKTIRDGIEKGLLNPRHGEPPPIAFMEYVPEEPEHLREEYSDTEPEASPTFDASAPETEPELDADAEDDETPALPEALWRSGFAEFRAAWGHTTESPDAFLWSAYFVAAAAVLGRGPSLALGVDVRANVNVANLGRSGGARKSTGQGKADRILANVDQGVTVLHGIGSPEGLIEALSNDSGQFPRVLVNLGELSTLLRKGAQEATRGLAPLLCTLFDCPPSVSLPNRKNPLEAREPFLCIIGSTTPEWLRADLTIDDVRGGLAGRFCYFVGTPKAPIPLPPPPDAIALTAAETILKAARDRSGSPREYDLDADARETFSAWYIAERAREYQTAILDTLAQRLHVFAWKAALMFAVLEGSDTITQEQMAAALAFADYQRATQAAVFHGFGESPAARCAERILAALSNHGPLAGWELAQRVRHVEPETLSRAIQTLARSGRIELRPDGRKRVYVVLGRHGAKGSAKDSGKGVS